jgi:hypothetical protein
MYIYIHMKTEKFSNTRSTLHMLPQQQNYKHLGFKAFIAQKARQEYVVDMDEDTTVDDHDKPMYDNVRFF